MLDLINLKKILLAFLCGKTPTNSKSTCMEKCYLSEKEQKKTANKFGSPATDILGASIGSLTRALLAGPLISLRFSRDYVKRIWNSLVQVTVLCSFCCKQSVKTCCRFNIHCFRNFLHILIHDFVGNVYLYLDK